MSITSIITFKAGQCDIRSDTDPPRVKPLPEPGYIYLYTEDELLYFCWRPRAAPADNPSLSLVMIPEDGSFTPYRPTSSQTTTNTPEPTNGRIYVLKFSSSSQRHFFWLQSRSQHQSRDPAWFSSRDLKLGETVNALLQGEDIDVQQAIANLPSTQGGADRDEDDDATMEDVEGTGLDPSHHRGGSGGAGPGATGGDVREEGQEAREGGADGGRAPPSSSAEASSIIQSFIQSMGGAQGGQQPQENLFTSLADLLTPTSTIPMIESADAAVIERLLEFLPPNLLDLAQQTEDAAIARLDSSSVPGKPDLEKAKAVICRVLRSPQFSQSLASLTIALRDGGLPSISEALNVPVQNGGFLRRGGVPLGGGDAVEAFLNGVKELAKKKSSSQN